MDYLETVGLATLGYVLCAALGYILGHYFGVRKGTRSGLVKGELSTWLKMKKIVDKRIKQMKKEE
jgi:hypothetical protein